MSRNPQADLVAQLVDENPDVRVQVVGDQVLEVGPGDVGKIVVVQPDGTLGFTADSGPVLTVNGRTGNVAGLSEAVDLSAHLGDTLDAHAASAIAFTPTGTLASTTVQAAIVEAATEAAAAAEPIAAAHIADGTDAHVASAIGFSPVGTVAAVTVQAAIAELDTEKAAITATPQRITVSKTDGNWAPGSTAGAWVDGDGTGTAAARTYDVVIPNAVAGDKYDFTVSAIAGAGVGGLSVTMASIVAGAVVNRFASATLGVSAWVVLASVTRVISGSFPYVLQAGDISGGVARFRVQLNTTATGSTLFGGSIVTGSQIVLEAVGPLR